MDHDEPTYRDYAVWARQSLEDIAREAVPPKARHATKATRASKERRLAQKRRRSQTKAQRGRVDE